jgi:hypothetical protein
VRDVRACRREGVGETILEMRVGRPMDRRCGERRAVARSGLREMEREAMKYDAMGLLYEAAMALKKIHDDATAFAVLEMANNLRLLMCGEGTIEDWNRIYVGADAPPFDIEKLVPVRRRRA